MTDNRPCVPRGTHGRITQGEGIMVEKPTTEDIEKRVENFFTAVEPTDAEREAAKLIYDYLNRLYLCIGEAAETAMMADNGLSVSMDYHTAELAQRFADDLQRSAYTIEIATTLRESYEAAKKGLEKFQGFRVMITTSDVAEIMGAVMSAFSDNPDAKEAVKAAMANAALATANATKID
jgi:hypothetical protein